MCNIPLSTTALTAQTIFDHIEEFKYLIHFYKIHEYFFPSFPSQFAMMLLCFSSFTAPSVAASFSFDLVQVTEQQVELRWSDLSTLNQLNISSFEIFLQYQEEADEESGQGEEDGNRKSEDKKGTQSQSSVKKVVRVPIFVSSRGVTVAGLSPGSVYSFTLRASHPAGSTWSLGQTRTAYTSESAGNLSHTVTQATSYANILNAHVLFLTGPLPPQNITVGPITVSQISVHWMLTDAQLRVGWTFVVRYVDMSSRKESMVGMTNISRFSETGGLQSYTAVIGGLESYRKYRVEVYTVTQNGVQSCGRAPVTVQTGKCVTGLF